jgi:hypothetical protein
MRNDDRTCDSRRLRSEYQLNAASDIPQDFPIPISVWRAAVFIPGETQEDPQFLAFPPRIYVLTCDTLSVFSHPTFKEAPLVVPLCEILEVELQKSSFIGILQLWRKDNFLRFHYNSVHQKPMNGFLRELRFMWLGCGHEGTIQTSIPIPASFRNLRYRSCYALRTELGSREALYRFCFQAALPLRRKQWSFKPPSAIREWLLAVTDYRIIVISDSGITRRGTGEVTIRYTATSNLKAIEILETPSVNDRLSLRFEHGRSWELAFTKDEFSSVREFVKALGETYSLDGSVKVTATAENVFKVYSTA